MCSCVYVIRHVFCSIGSVLSYSVTLSSLSEPVIREHLMTLWRSLISSFDLAHRWLWSCSSSLRYVHTDSDLVLERDASPTSPPVGRLTGSLAQPIKIPLQKTFTLSTVS